MAHINPIKSRLLSPEGRDNYDRIFRKSPETRLNEHLAELEEMGRELGVEWKERQAAKAREIYHELRQKHQDESA